MSSHAHRNPCSASPHYELHSPDEWRPQLHIVGMTKNSYCGTNRHVIFWTVGPTESVVVPQTPYYWQIFFEFFWNAKETCRGRGEPVLSM
eukprot:GHVN01019911.1.p1 GENE.GHVN01019911.1~~GHVN01019911.1.p1  ORF type:complete len:101 (+),score=5.99 GHVN01019911.1:34-303(+)